MVNMSKIVEAVEKDAFAEYMNPPEKLKEHRCCRCNRLLGKFSGKAEVKCPKCGEINRIGVK